MMSVYVLMALVVMLPLEVLLHSRQSHVYNNHVSDLAIDGDSDTCMILVDENMGLTCHIPQCQTIRLVSDCRVSIKCIPTKCHSVTVQC